jgi:hypothetical protein
MRLINTFGIRPYKGGCIHFSVWYKHFDSDVHCTSPSRRSLLDDIIIYAIHRRRELGFNTSVIRTIALTKPDNSFRVGQHA